ncbi:MAG: hypothetical protein KA533_02405 [Sphingobium sp.]|nr:hypothetical protein [Sphingobium sp.]MBP6110948.1 hypothetical protein [Sphingobium sp.]MBP8670646.1 hypothetical protein [Sphingobium sp.]MBP9156980.1 hypothetical protein [Sphingobium sp.]MCC6481849.1 hypothetical protein [Sphingomonadaceae bacterium]
MRHVIIGGLLFIALTSASAMSRTDGDAQNNLTHGMAQMTLHLGTTTQSEVLEAFGAPNITTLDAAGQEVWVYDRHATVATSGSSGFSIGMLLGAGGGGVGGGGGLGFGSSKSKASQTQRTMTLIIKFGPDKKVVDFKSRSSSF